MSATSNMTPLGDFCRDYLEIGVDVAGWGKWFLIGALVAGGAYATVEVWKRLKATGGDDGGKSLTATGLPIKDLADALRELVAALATAPVWLALMAVGVLVFWAPSATIPGKCESAETYAPVPKKS